MVDVDTRDRVIRLEAEVTALKETVANAVVKIDEMHAVLMMAKGARWVTIAIATMVGLVVGASHKVAAVFGPWGGQGSGQ